MARGTRIRCLVVWSTVTTALVAVARWAGPDALVLTDAGTPPDFEALLVGSCSLAAVLCAAWCWAVTTLTTVEVLRDRHHARPAVGTGVVRRVVLVLCGVAVTAQLAGPAAAVESTADPLHGLSVPDRAVAPTSAPLASRPRPAPPRTGPTTVVRAGDTLWSLARDSLGPAAGPARTAARWHDIYAANRDVVGTDPDLIHPGQRLRVPPPTEEQR